jgi:hypothetical protein
MVGAGVLGVAGIPPRYRRDSVPPSALTPRFATGEARVACGQPARAWHSLPDGG